MDVVKKKIQSLQQQVDDAEDRALEIQRELDTERELHEKVRLEYNFFNSSCRTFTLFSTISSLFNFRQALCEDFPLSRTAGGVFHPDMLPLNDFLKLFHRTP